MRIQRWFRPVLADDLECRVVPSTANVALPPALIGQVAPLPPQLQNADQAQEEFLDFVAKYTDAIDSVLLSPGSNGAIDPERNREAFDAVIKQALTTLTDQLVQSLGPVPLNSPEVAQVVDAMIGDGPESLENQLLGIPTATIVQDATTGTLTGETLHTIVQAAAQVKQTVDYEPNSPPVTQAIVVQSPTAATQSYDKDATIDLSPRSNTELRNAFSGFMNDYFQTVRDVLLAPDSNGQLDPSANRAEFNAKVEISLQALVDAISVIGALRGAGLQQTARIRLELPSNEPGHLKQQLASLPNPIGPEATLVRDFTLGSFRTIVALFTRLSGPISGA